MTPHPDFDQFVAALKRCPLAKLDRHVYRAVASKYAADKDLLSGEGSLAWGGRWNFPRTFRVVYASFDDHTALAESKSIFATYGFTKPERRTIVPVKVSLARTIELATLAGLLAIDINTLVTFEWRKEQDLGNEAPTQAIGRAAMSLNVQGIVVPSSAHAGGLNLVVIRDHVQIPAELEILDPSPAPGL